MGGTDDRTNADMDRPGAGSGSAPGLGSRLRVRRHGVFGRVASDGGPSRRARGQAGDGLRAATTFGTAPWSGSDSRTAPGKKKPSIRVDATRSTA